MINKKAAAFEGCRFFVWAWGVTEATCGGDEDSASRGPHPALRATFPVRGEGIGRGFAGGEGVGPCGRGTNVSS